MDRRRLAPHLAPPSGGAVVNLRGGALSTPAYFDRAARVSFAPSPTAIPVSRRGHLHGRPGENLWQPTPGSTPARVLLPVDGPVAEL